MELRQFLLNVQHAESYERIGSVCFQSSQPYPLLFFSTFFGQLKKKLQSDYVALDEERENLAQIQIRLSSSFLGMSSLYWLRSVTDLDKKTSTQLIRYLRDYQGPHTVMFFTTESVTMPMPWQTVTLPDAVDRSLFIFLMEWTGFALTTRMAQGIDALYSKVKHLSLDHALLLMSYLKTVGVHQQQFLDSWLDMLIAPDTSLFTLSQYFFAKDHRAFFAAWKAIEMDYADSFWVVFWSEQLWRAFYYVQLMRMHKVAEAKKIAYRLPFSFIQRDWKKLTAAELQQAHARIYALDYALKNGASTYGFDLFYSHFFLDSHNASKQSVPIMSSRS